MTDSPSDSGDIPKSTDATYCPYCGEQALKDTEDWKIIDGNMHVPNSCASCNGKFEAISHFDAENISETHTLQFVFETNDEDKIIGVEAVQRIEADEDSPGVIAERTQLNMAYGGCGEVQGPAWAIKQLYEYITTNEDLPIDTSGEAGEWIST